VGNGDGRALGTAIVHSVLAALSMPHAATR
jgi:hypothetical protein